MVEACFALEETQQWNDFPFIGLVELQEGNEQSSVGASQGELLRAARAGCIKKTHTMHKHQITP